MAAPSQSKLCRTCGQILSQYAVHPRHGLTWTDGTAIYLSPLRLQHGNLENTTTIKLGAFKSVSSLQWSSEIGPKSCYLSVVHEQNVSIWKVDGEVPQLKFKLVRKINTSPIPQGCLWNPSNDILCLLCRDGCSFYFKHIQNKGSYAFPPLESGRISCGVWSEDGSKLAVCLDSLLLVYSWSDIDGRISDATPTAWRMPGQGRRITSITALSSHTFVLSAEVSLEAHCQPGTADSFIIPGVETVNSGSVLSSQNDNDVIKARKEATQSYTDGLFNLQRNPKLSEKVTAQLLLVKLDGPSQEIELVTRIDETILMSPDLLTYLPQYHHIVVGSNTQNIIHLYRVVEGKMFLEKQIMLEASARPKGLCCSPSVYQEGSSNFFLLEGKPLNSDPTFVPSSTQSHFKLRLRCIAAPDVSHSAKGPSLNKAKSALPPLFANNHCTESRSDFDTHSLSSGSSGGSAQNSPRNMQMEISSSQDTSFNSQSSLESPPPLLPPKTNQNRALVQDLDRDIADQGKPLEVETVKFSEKKPFFRQPDPSDFEKPSVFANKNMVHTKVAKKLPVGPESVFTDKPLHVEVAKKQPVAAESVQGEYLGMNDAKVIPPLRLISRKGKAAELDGSYDANATDLTEEQFLEQQLKVQQDQIAQLQKKIDRLSSTVEQTSCIFPTHYQSATAPEIVQLVCTSDGPTEKKTFLLDNGRLQLDTVKTAFSLDTLEIMINGLPIVVGKNIDGYIPMKFDPSSTWNIGGKPAEPDLRFSDDDMDDDGQFSV